MLDIKPKIVAELSNILPCYYELFCDSNTPTPCITYMEAFNGDSTITNEFGYSRVIFNIKVWDRADSFDFSYAQQIDKVMRDMGFTRNSSNEIVVDNMIEQILTYQTECFEEYDL